MLGKPDEKHEGAIRLLDKRDSFLKLAKMAELRILTAAEQVADYLEKQLSRGIWTGTMPGGERLARELGVGRMTVETALAMLEDEGFLVSRGAGRRREIVLPKKHTAPNLRIGILLFARADSKIYYNVDLQHRLMNAGHSARFASKSLSDLRMDPARIARFVENSPADGWVISSGSREVLEWFANHHIPAFAISGRRRGIRIASIGPDKEAAVRVMVQRLVALGHRRIVMISPAVLRQPEPARIPRVFLDALETHGIQHGPYNLPDWDESAEGLQQLLAKLYRHTPPTALFAVESNTFIAIQQHLAQRGILAPRDVSLISDDPDPVFSLCRPTVAHIRWDASPYARRVVRWAENVARGKTDLRCSFTKAEFVEGGTIGPAPR